MSQDEYIDEYYEEEKDIKFINIYNKHIQNIHRSKSDYDDYMTDIPIVIKATLSRQIFILRNRFKYLIENLRKNKV
jgi:hypothetical protein